MQRNLELVRWGSLKILSETIIEIDKFKIEYFSNDTSLIFGELEKTFLAGQASNWSSILASLKLEEPEGIDSDKKYLQKYLEILRENWEKEEIANTIRDIHLAPPKLEIAKERIYKLVSILDDQTVAQEAELFQGKRVKEIIDSTKHRDSSNGVFTGIKDLDELLGGFDPGEFVILAARTSMGKTALAIQVALNNSYYRGRPTLFFSLEDTADNIVLRCVSNLTGIDFYKLKYNKLDEGDDYQINKIVKKFSECPLMILDSSQTIRSILSISRKLKAKYPDLNLIVVDYLQMITSSKELYEATSDSSQALKNLAKDLKVVSLSLSQLNRECEKRDNHRPIKSDLRQSGNLEQDADRIIFLYRPGYYEPDNEAIQNICEYIAAKNRHGQIKNIIGECYLSCFQFN